MSRSGPQVDPSIFSRFDGFSPLTSMVTVFEGRLDTSTLADQDHIEDCLLPSSNTVLLDAETGERVAHFAEIDRWRSVDPSHAPFYVRPAARLRENARYIVAIRGLRHQDGSAVEPSLYFRALRDGEPTEAAELEARREVFEDIFTRLESAGVARGDLLEAWDFHTATGETAWSDLVAMRDDAMERVGARGVGCTVTEVIEHTVEEDPHNYRFVTGTFTAPRYVSTEEPGATLVRDAREAPAFQAMMEVPFTVAIPHSVRDRVAGGGAPARLLTYGHGLFGGQDEVRTGWLQEFMDTHPTVATATDWWGMSSADVPVAGVVLSDLSGFPRVTERMLQGVINVLVMTRSMAGVCSELAELGVDGAPMIDGDDRYFLGISQGGIMGATVAAVSVDIERFVLQVGGVSYPIMVKRSSDFGGYAGILETFYGSFDSNVMLVASASQWDIAEPSTYISHVVSDPLPGTPPKRLLYLTGWFDTQVPNIASDIAMRTAGVPLMVPTVRDVWGIETTTGPSDSAYVQYRIDGTEPWEPGTLAPPGDSPAHEGVRRNPAAQAQMDAFLRPDGVVTSYCDGACDPE